MQDKQDADDDEEIKFLISNPFFVTVEYFPQQQYLKLEPIL